MAISVIEWDEVIHFGLRSIFSAVAIFCILYGFWKSEKIFDDEDIDEFDDLEKIEYNGVTDVVAEVIENAYKSITNEKYGDLKSVTVLYSGPQRNYLWLAVFGWVLLSISFHLSPVETFGWQNSIESFMATFVIIILCIMHCAVLPTAQQDQWVHVYYQYICCMLVVGYLLLGSLLVVFDTFCPIWLPIVGVICILAAHQFLWWARKRGDSYDRAGAKNEKAVTYNLGGPLLVTGWIMVWVAMNSHRDVPEGWYLPIYWTSRAAVAFDGILAVFGIYWAVGYAHDEYDEDPLDGSDPQPPNSFFFGGINEIRASFVIVWLILGVASFLPYSAQGFFFPVILFFAILLQGFAVGVQQVLGLRARDEMKLDRWTRVIGIFFVAIAVLVFLSHGIAGGILCLCGGSLIMLGWDYLLHDRKRGAYWIEKEEINPKHTVYSFGSLIFPAGLILLGWGLSIP